jgi:hypothetical protein
MDAVALLRRAQEVGLRVEPMGDRLLAARGAFTVVR